MLRCVTAAVPRPSNMGAEGEVAFSSPLATAATPLGATAAPPVTMSKWRPRDGHNASYVAWEQFVFRLCCSLGIDYDTLTSPPPSIPSSSHRYPTTSAVKMEAGGDAAMMDWLARNTALHHGLLPSLLIDGSAQLQDQRRLNEFVKGQLADGRGVYMWARAFADVSGMDAQAELLVRVVSAKLKVGATGEQIREHALLMLERWAQLEGSDREHPYPYYKYLVGLLSVAAAARVCRADARLAARQT